MAPGHPLDRAGTLAFVSRNSYTVTAWASRGRANSTRSSSAHCCRTYQKRATDIFESPQESPNSQQAAATKNIKGRKVPQISVMKPFYTMNALLC